MGMSRFIRWTSAIALAAVLIAIAITVGVRVRRKAAIHEDAGPTIISQPDTQDDAETAIGLNKNFNYLERINGKLVFALEALQTLGKKSNWHEIEGITLHLYDDEGEPGPVLTCRQASFNSRTKNARLSGNIHILFPDGAFLSTEKGSLKEGGQTFSTGTKMTYVSKELIGTANRVDLDMKTSKIILSGGVILQSSEGNSLRAPRMEYSRKRQILQFSEGIRMLYGGAHLEANHALIRLEGQDNQPRSIDLKGDVRVRFDDAVSGRRLESRCESLFAKRDAGDSWQVDARASSGWVEFQSIGGGNNLAEIISAWRIKAVFGQGSLRSARTMGRSCFTIVPPEGEIRRGEAQSIRFWMKAGTATAVELEKNVVLYDSVWRAKAASGRMDFSTRRVILQGDPMGSARVILKSDEGVLTADQAFLVESRDHAELRGRVQGEVFKGDLAWKHAEENEHLHIASGALTISEQEYRLSEGARAWQGEELLVADEIRYRPGGGDLYAAGHVRTTFPAVMMDEKAQPGEDVVLIARIMDYSRSGRKAHYQGQVVFSSPSQVLSASDLLIELSEDNDVQKVIATGAVLLKDLKTGQELQGNTVVRDFADGLITVEGSPARATDSAGNLLSGHRLTFNEADGSVIVSEETETIYHSEEPKTEPEKP